MQPDLRALAGEVVLLLKSALTPVQERLAVTDERLNAFARALLTVDDLTKENAALRERVAVLEARPLIPGPPGDPGPPGADGKDGTPGLEWKKTYKDDLTYEPGQIVKWGGSTYVCIKTTSGTWRRGPARPGTAIRRRRRSRVRDRRTGS